MKALLYFALIVAVGLPVCSEAGVVTVNCNGGAMYTDLRAAILASTAYDTVLVYPCEYFVDPGYPPYVALWPITLSVSSPSIASTGGAEATILVGDGTIPAFVIEDGARVDMNGLTFRNLKTPLSNDEYMNTSSVFRFIDNIVELCEFGLNASCAPSSAVVSGNVVRYNGGNGISVYHNSGIIENNEVCFNTGGTYSSGIAGWCCETPTVRGNYVHDNSSIGIKLGFLARMSENLIEDNGGAGIWLSYTNIIDNNVIRGNATGVLITDYASHGTMEVECNDIYGNSGYDVEIWECAEGGNWNFCNNWWGTTDPDEIATHILDCEDDPNIDGCVLFDPWADGPGCGPTAVPERELSWGSIKALFRE